VKIYDSSEETEEAGGTLSQALGAVVCGAMGGTVLLVRVRTSGSPSTLKAMLDALS